MSWLFDIWGCSGYSSIPFEALIMEFDETIYVNPLKKIPKEVWFIIFSYCSTNDLGRFCCVCKSWKELAEDDILWQQLTTYSPTGSHVINAPFGFGKYQFSKTHFTTSSIKKHTVSIIRNYNLFVKNKDTFYQYKKYGDGKGLDLPIIPKGLKSTWNEQSPTWTTTVKETFSSMSGFFSNYQIYNKEMRILSLGIDGAGNTSLLYSLKLGEVVSSMITIGFCIETFMVDGTRVNMWDVGGRPQIRPLWQHYYPHTEGIIFVIDSNESYDRMMETKETLHSLCTEMEAEENSNLLHSFLFVANKWDLNATNIQRSLHELANLLELNTIPLLNRECIDWFIVPCCASSPKIGVGSVWIGMQWMVSRKK